MKEVFSMKTNKKIITASKKSIALILTFLLLCTVFPLSFAEELPKSLAPDVPMFGNINSAAAFVRKQLRDHRSDVRFVMDTGDGEMIYNTDIVLLACGYTGDGKEGDYLTWNLECTVYGNSDYVYDDETGEYLYEITDLGFRYYTTPAEEAELDKKLAETMASLKLNGLTDREKVKRIYDYVYSHVRYDYDYVAKSHTAYAALIQGKAVCQGIAALFYRMALYAGIDCRMVYGWANGNHMWNAVKLDGKVYWLDCTWDINRREGGATDYAYFLRNVSDMDRRETDFTYSLSEFDRIPSYVPEKGDVNRDGKIGADDARLALRASVGLENFKTGSVEFIRCDVNGDGKLAADDARIILRASVGLAFL